MGNWTQVRLNNFTASVVLQDSSLDAKNRNAIRYLSFHDHQYINFFSAHVNRVTSLAMSPKTDQFMSGGLVRFPVSCCPLLSLWSAALRMSYSQPQWMCPSGCVPVVTIYIRTCSALA